MNIELNGNVYVVERIKKHASEGTRITPVPAATQLQDLESAPVNDGNILVVTAVGKDRFKVLVKPNQAIDAKTVTYLLSKVILKKCTTDAMYVPSAAPAPMYRDRDRDMDQRPRRDQGYGSHRNQGSSSRYFGNR